METLQQSKRHFSKLGWMLFLGALLCFVTQYLPVRLVQQLSPGLLEDSNLSLIISMLPLYLFGMPLMAFLIRRLPADRIAVHKLNIRQWLLAFCICYGLMYVSNLMGIFTTEIIGILKGSAVENVVAELVAELSPWAAIPFMVVLAPIFEEYIFRKLIIDRTIHYGEGIAIVVSAFLFALFHGNLNQFAYAFVLGLFWGFLYAKTGSVKYTIWMHMCINFLGSVPGMLMMRSEAYQGILTLASADDLQQLALFLSEHVAELILFMGYSLAIIIFALSGIVLFFINLKKMRLNSGEIVLPKGQRFRTVILNLGMLFNIGFWGVQIILQLFR